MTFPSHLPPSFNFRLSLFITFSHWFIAYLFSGIDNDLIVWQFFNWLSYSSCVAYFFHTSTELSQRFFIRWSLVALTLVRKIVSYEWNKGISNEFKSSERILLNLVLKNRGFRSRVSRKSGAVCVFEDDRPKSSDGWFSWLVKLAKFPRFELHIHKLNDTFSIRE